MEKETLPPYPPSWLDWLIARIGRLPGPPWIFYLAVMVILALVSQTLRWLEGSEQVGVFNIARLIETPIWCRSGCISLGTPKATLVERSQIGVEQLLELLRFENRGKLEELISV